MDDEDQATLQHLSAIADILNNHCPPDVIAWNKALDEVTYDSPKTKRRKAKKGKQRD